MTDTTKTAEALADCPFCGAAGVKERIHTLTWHDRYGCDACNVWFGSARQWNARSLAAQPQAEAVFEPTQRDEFHCLRDVQRAGIEGLARPAPAPAQVAPIDMVLHCPKCGKQHIDMEEEVQYRDCPPGWRTTWTNPPHRSHLCAVCGHIWRPADVPTNGVAAVKTKGKADSPIASGAPAQVAEPVGGAAARGRD